MARRTNAMPAFIDLVTTALADPFRIALLAALVFTQRRTAGQTGTVIPLALGVAFVALMIPMTMGYDESLGMPTVVGAGVVANIVLLIPILLVLRLWQKSRP
jgi:hypothetical protein